MQYQQHFCPQQPQQQPMPVPLIPSNSYIPVRPLPQPVPPMVAPIPQYQPYVAPCFAQQAPQPMVQYAVQPVYPQLPPSMAPAPQQAPLVAGLGVAPRLDPARNVQYVNPANNQPHFQQTDCRRLAQQRDGVVDCQHPYQLYIDKQKK